MEELFALDVESSVSLFLLSSAGTGTGKNLMKYNDIVVLKSNFLINC